MEIVKQYRGLRKELYVLVICTFVDKAGSLVGPMLTLILSLKMNMNASEIALYFLVYTLLSLPIHLLGGRLTDKINKKLLINVCDIITSLIYIICGIIGLNKITLLVYLMGSLLQSVESPAYKSLIADFTTSENRERAYSLNYLAMNVGFAISPTLAGLMINNYVGLMFVLSGVFELMSLILFDVFVKNLAPIKDASNKYEAGVEDKSTGRILRESKVLIPYMIIFALSMLVYDMFGYLMPLSLTKVHGETGSVFFGTISSVNGIAVLVFTAVLTALFAKRTTIQKMISGNAFEFAGLLIFSLFIGHPIVYYPAMVIFTLGEILNTTTTTPHLTRRIPLNYRGRIIAVVSVVESAVTSLGKYGLGKVYDNFGDSVAWAIVLVISVGTILGYMILGSFDKKQYPNLYIEKRL